MNTYIRWMTRWANEGDGFIRRWRAQRMRQMVERLGLRAGDRILDLGGTESLWQLADLDVHVTLVNTPGSDTCVSDSGRFALILGDACDLREIPDASYDFVFSNSVIEHVGGPDRQESFAREARRLGRGYWVQTPSDRFPIEAHTGIPFYWSLPERWRARLLKRWHGRSAAWAWAIDNTVVLPLARMRALFPDGEVYVEHKFGFEKSYALYRTPLRLVDRSDTPSRAARSQPPLRHPLPPPTQAPRPKRVA